MKFLSVLNRKCAIALTVVLLYQVGMVQLELNNCLAKPARLDRQIKHVSSYQSMDGAIENVNSLKSKGIDAFYEKVMIPGKGFWYRVYAVKNQTSSQIAALWRTNRNLRRKQYKRQIQQVSRQKKSILLKVNRISRWSRLKVSKNCQMYRR